jgi:hypothetical protein
MGKSISSWDEVLGDNTTFRDLHYTSPQLRHDGFVASSNTVNTCKHKHKVFIKLSHRKRRERKALQPIRQQIRPLLFVTFDTRHDDQVNSMIGHDGSRRSLKAQRNLSGLARSSIVCQASSRALESADLEASGCPKGGAECLLENTLHFCSRREGKHHVNKDLGRVNKKHSTPTHSPLNLK